MYTTTNAYIIYTDYYILMLSNNVTILTKSIHARCNYALVVYYPTHIYIYIYIFSFYVLFMYIYARCIYPLNVYILSLGHIKNTN